MTKQILIPRGQNIGNAIKNSFTSFKQVNIDYLEVARDTTNKVNVATVIYSY